MRPSRRRLIRLRLAQAVSVVARPSVATAETHRSAPSPQRRAVVVGPAVGRTAATAAAAAAALIILAFIVQGLERLDRATTAARPVVVKEEEAAAEQAQ